MRYSDVLYGQMKPVSTGRMATTAVLTDAQLIERYNAIVSKNAKPGRLDRYSAVAPSKESKRLERQLRAEMNLRGLIYSPAK